jgi:hypothetical protein
MTDIRQKLNTEGTTTPLQAMHLSIQITATVQVKTFTLKRYQKLLNIVNVTWQISQIICS